MGAGIRAKPIGPTRTKSRYERRQNVTICTVRRKKLLAWEGRYSQGGKGDPPAPPGRDSESPRFDGPRSVGTERAPSNCARANARRKLIRIRRSTEAYAHRRRHLRAMRRERRKRPLASRSRFFSHALEARPIIADALFRSKAQERLTSAASASTPRDDEVEMLPNKWDRT